SHIQHTTIFSPLFYLHCTSHYRALPSSPTRRSSDLTPNHDNRGHRSAVQRPLHFHRFPTLRTPSVSVSIADQASSWRSAGYLPLDRKSTRLNSSHVKISYAVFCLKKKRENQ